MSAEEITKRIGEISESGYTGPVYPRLELKTSRIVYVLLAGEPGDVILDENWPESLGGCAPKGKSYTSLMSAERYVLRTHGIVWERVMGEGRIKCLSHGERVQTAGGKVKAAGRRALVAGRVLDATDRSALTQDERARANSLAIQAALIHKSAAGKTTRKLEARDDSARLKYLAEYLVLGKD